MFSLNTTGGTTNLALTWPQDHTGWTLQSQTNLANTNWINVSGSTLTNAVSIPINSSVKEMFYRLVYP